MLGALASPPRRVLITLDAVGGVWRYALDVARGLQAFDVECLLVGFGPEPNPAQRAECKSLANAELAWITEPLDWMASDAAALNPGTAKLAALIADWDPDLLHLNLPSQAAGLPHDRPTVVASHSCVATWWDSVRGTELPAEWTWQRDRNRQGMQQADALVVPSESHAAALRRVYGRLPNLHVVHNGIAVTPYAGPKKNLVLGVGRWWDNGKNGAVLDDAAPSVPWPITLVGPLHGPNGEHIAFRNVQASGAISHDETLALMRHAAIFAAPSRYEPFGLAVAEAAINGAALVLADIPTFRELWDGAALLVPSDDTSGWIQALSRLAANPAERQFLSARAAARASTYTLPRQAAALYDVYTRANMAAMA